MRDCPAEIPAKDHVRLAGVTVTTGVGKKGPDQHVVVSVVVDVAGGAHGVAGLIARINTVESESVAAIERREVQGVWCGQQGSIFQVFDARHGLGFRPFVHSSIGVS